MSLCSRVMQQIVNLPQPVIAAVQAGTTFNPTNVGIRDGRKADDRFGL